MSKLDIAKQAAKDAADETKIHMQTLAEERQKDAERRQKIYQRSKDIRNLDEGVEVLKTEIMRKKQKEDEREARLLHVDTTNVYYNALKKVSGIAKSYYTGKKTTNAPDEEAAAAAAKAEGSGDKRNGDEAKAEEKETNKEDAKNMKSVEAAGGEGGVAVGDDSTKSEGGATKNEGGS